MSAVVYLTADGVIRRLQDALDSQAGDSGRGDEVDYYLVADQGRPRQFMVGGFQRSSQYPTSRSCDASTEGV